MVFWSGFAKKVRESVSKLSFDKLKNRVDTIENKYVKKDESNTLTQVNTFNANTNFKSRIEFRKPNNNGAYLDNFDFGNQNYTSFKLVKGSTNMLQIEVNNDTNTATISSPNTSNGLHINNLANPTNNDNAANKGYVDGLYNPLNTKVDGVISGLQNGNIVNYAGEFNSSTNYKLAQAVTHNGDWFVSKQNNNQGHAPTKTNNAYWVYISAPTVDLTQYLTKSEARSTYADRSYVDSLIVFGNWERLTDRLTKLNTKNENNRNWKWVGRINGIIVPQNLIDIKFDLRNRDFTQTNQWYELITFGWYKAGSDTIIWFQSPDSQLDDYDLISDNTYFQFISKR